MMCDKRRPFEPGDEVTIPVEKSYNTVCKAFPEVQSWWFGIHSVLQTVIPVNAAPDIEGIDFTKIERCSMANRSGQLCNKKPDFYLIAAIVDPDHSDKCGGARVRGMCSECLYLAMSTSLAGMTDPEFFEEASKVSDVDNPDWMYLVAERSNFLETHLPMVLEHLEENDPEALESLNQLIARDN